jgi:DNA polymerase III epsilon subunit family exonuclease
MVVGENHYWVVDVEGSGGTPPEIVELGMVEIADLKLNGNQRHWLIRPERSIQPAASRIHGLTDADVADAPSIEDIADDVMIWLDQAAIIGHNVRVELDIISRSIPEWKPRVAIDTLKIAKALRPGLDSYGLNKLGVALGHSDEAAKRSSRGHHSALYDATLTALIFIDLLSNVPEVHRADVLRDADILDRRQETLL